MLFNSYVFTFGFLPAVLILYQLTSKVPGSRAVVISLGLASLAFYAYWNTAFLPVLLASIIFNFLASTLISGRISSTLNRSLLLWFAIAVDLGALCYFKYLVALINFFRGLFHLSGISYHVALPLGISFFTFTQIAYLVDLQQGAAEQQSFSDYLLFVSFFPHLIAGPILHHKDMIPQFQKDRRCGLKSDDLALGLSWFAMGLAKKVIIADKISLFVDTIFSAHGAITSQMAWLAALGYSLQLYFDFSGYCDMALGLAKMLSIDFPLNFSSPFKAASIVEFWQRWHMTLSQYITDYLYSPIQFWISARRQSRGQKVTKKARATFEGFMQMIAFPTIVTMFIAGIWHGAGLQFLIFGLLHGAFMTIYHRWRQLRQQWALPVATGYWKYPAHSGSVLLTFLCVMITFVFFRSASSQDAMVMLERLALAHADPSAKLPTILGGIRSQWVKVFAGFVIVWAFPNTQQILSDFKPALKLASPDVEQHLIKWKPNMAWGLTLGLFILVALVQIQNPSTFLYFQF